MKQREQSANAVSRSKTGLLATLRVLLQVGGRSAPAARGGRSARSRRHALLTPVVLVTAIAGLAFSAAPALATTPPAEEPTTEMASSVTGTSAIFEGTLNPHGSAKVGGYFAYSAPNGLTCLEGPTAGLEEFEEKEAEAIAVHGLVGLEPDRKYQVCLVATNEVGEPTVGKPVTVQTPAIAPTVEVYGTTGVGPFSAHLEAIVNANNEEVTKCEYEYGTSPTLAAGTKTVPCEQATLEGVYGGQLASASVSGLTPATPYYYRVVATNATGPSGVSPETPIETFTTGTPEPPIYEGENATPKAHEATLEAAINPNFQQTEYKFEYSAEGSTAENKLEGTITTVEGAPPAALLPAEFAQFPVNVSTGPVLTPNTTYYYRVVATNATGPATERPVAEFKTAIVQEAPSGEEATAITGTTATLKGVVNPLNEGNPGTYEFLYRQSSSECQGGTPEEDKTTSQEGTTGTVGEEAKASLTGLVPKEDYTFCLLSRNGVGETAVGAPVMFETGVITPAEIETGNVEDVTTTSATFGGAELNPGGEARYYFEYSTELCGPSTCGTATVESTVSGHTQQAVAPVVVAGLQTGTIYHYWLVVKNALGTTHGEAKVFATAATPEEEAAEGAARAKPAEELAAAIAAQNKANEETKKQEEGTAAGAAAANKLYNELAAETAALGTPKLVPVPKTTTTKPKPVKCKKTQVRKGKKCVKKPKKKKRAHTSRRTNR